MKEFRVLAITTIAAVALAAGPIWAQAQKAPAAKGKAAATKVQRDYAKPAADSDDGPVVEQEAVDALSKMGAYLRTQNNFQVVSESSIDLVTFDDQKLAVGGQTTYKVRRPNGFVIENVTDRKSRTFVYDGKDLTVYAPTKGFYATAPAKPTIKETLDYASDNYGIELPLQDLFEWGDAGAPVRQFQSAYHIGVAKIDGVDTDHYAYRQGMVDWQIWIQTGDKPLPRKVVITDRSDPTMPQFEARLRWDLNPGFTDQTFAFKAPSGATPIRFAAL